MPYTCQCCFKTYTNKSWYDKHIIWCTDTPHNTKVMLEQIGDVPPTITMYKMILDLSSKVLQLENKCYELEKNQKKNDDALPRPPEIEYNKKPEMLFNEWYEKIEITKENLDTVLKTNIIDTFVNIIQDHLNNDLDEFCESIPPFIIDSNHKKIYIYEYNCDGWVPIRRENFSKMINNMITKLQNKFNILYNNNIVDPSSSEFDDYIRNVEKVMSANDKIVMNNVYKTLTNR